MFIVADQKSVWLNSYNLIICDLYNNLYAKLKMHIVQVMFVFFRICWNASLGVWLQAFNLQTSTPLACLCLCEHNRFWTGRCGLVWWQHNRLYVTYNHQKTRCSQSVLWMQFSMSENVTLMIEMYTLVIYHRRNECGASTLTYQRFSWRAFV